jgi:hypothetical protein
MTMVSTNGPKLSKEKGVEIKKTEKKKTIEHVLQLLRVFSSLNLVLSPPPHHSPPPPVQFGLLKFLFSNPMRIDRVHQVGPGPG